ncbi:hypothetical protein [Aquisphaera insulae]|uniref:hypothetical protein n=1 Tax=Aquisphaera insulae TaxID=2712864 RepID=UPI0013EA4BFF|nr:hypothetical protein [Aquisphaera insulae]
MASELVASVVDALQRETTMGYEAGLQLVPTGTVRGLALPRNKNVGYDAVLKIPGNATLTTGLKVDVVVVDDGSNAADLGTAVVIGASVKLLADNTDSLDLTSGAGTEQTATVTLASTAGVLRVGTISIANANLDSAAAGNWIGVRIRRVADNASDTCTGRVVLAGVAIYAY